MRRAIFFFLLAFAAAAPGAHADRLGAEYWGPMLEPKAPPPGQGPGPGRHFTGAVEDVRAYWPHWFERNKEVLLAELARTRRAAVAVDRERMAEKVAPVLLECLVNPSSLIRDEAVMALGRRGGDSAVNHLDGRIEDPDTDVREDALLALGLSGSKSALAPLLRGLTGDAPNLQAFAALGLALYGDADFIPSLLDEYRVLLRRESKEAPDAAIGIAIAVGALGGEKHVKDLAKLAGRDDTLKICVCSALGRIGGEDARKWLLKAVHVRGKPVNAAACLALASLPEKPVVITLMKDGLKSGDRNMMLCSVLALGSIAKRLPESDGIRKTIRQELVEIAESPRKDKYAAQYAAFALAIAGEHGADEFLLSLLKKDNRTKLTQENHSAAAMALGLLRVKKAAPDLREIVADSSLDPDYRGYAAFALGLLGDPAEKSGIRRAMLAPQAPPELLRSGAWAIGLLGGETDVPLLIDLLGRDDPDLLHARHAATRAIGMIGDEAAVEPLLAMAKDTAERLRAVFAIRALGYLLDPSPVDRIPALLAGMNHRAEPGIVKEIRGIR